MSSTIVTVLLWVAAISSGLMAGVYFAFSSFIMRAFDNLDTTQAIAAMNAINKTILHSLFMPLFFGSSIISVLLMGAAYHYWSEPGATVTLIAGAVYCIGMFICTALFNVPLNNLLALQGPDSANAYQVWDHYLKTWTNWNHLRTVSSLVTSIFCVWLLSN